MTRYLLGTLLALHLIATVVYAEPQPEDAALLQQVEHYQLLVQQAGNQAINWNSLGFTFYRLNRIPEAIAAYQQALVADPGYALAYNNLGAAHLSLKEYPQGETAFRQALQCEPTNAKAAYNLAVALYRQSRYREAYNAYCNAKKVDAAYVKQRLDKSKAREELQGKLKDDPDNQFLLLALKRLDDE